MSAKSTNRNPNDQCKSKPARTKSTPGNKKYKVKEKHNKGFKDHPKPKARSAVRPYPWGPNDVPTQAMAETPKLFGGGNPEPKP